MKTFRKIFDNITRNHRAEMQGFINMWMTDNTRVKAIVESLYSDSGKRRAYSLAQPHKKRGLLASLFTRKPASIAAVPSRPSATGYMYHAQKLEHEYTLRARYIPVSSEQVRILSSADEIGRAVMESVPFDSMKIDARCRIEDLSVTILCREVARARKSEFFAVAEAYYVYKLGIENTVSSTAMLTPEQKILVVMQTEMELASTQSSSAAAIRYKIIEFMKSKEWQDLRRKVFARDGYKCANKYCQFDAKTEGLIYHVDHIEPKSDRPELMKEMSNLQVLCEYCNVAKGTKSNSVWMRDQYGAFA